MRVVVVHAQDGTVNVAVEDQTGEVMETGTGRSTGPDGVEVPRGGLLNIVATDPSGGEPDFDELSTEGPSEAEPEETLLGVPMSEVGAVTLDGLHWLEVIGGIYVSGLDQPDPLEGPTLMFDVGPPPFGLHTGATVVTARHRVVAVARKAAA